MSTRPLVSTWTLTDAVATVSVYALTVTVAIATVSVNVDTSGCNCNHYFTLSTISGTCVNNIVTMQNRWNNRNSDGCVYAQIRKGLGMHLVTYSNHDTVPFLLIVPIKGRFV